MKINKKAMNILGVALVYTITSSFVALMPDNLVATNSYFSTKGEVNAAISLLKSEEIIYINAEDFDINKWIETSATGIYLSNVRDDGKPIIVYFEVLGSLRDLVGGINPMKIYPGEKGEELIVPIRDISLFELKDNVFSGAINVRAFNDYINDLAIEIPEIEGNKILTIKSKEWPYGSSSMSRVTLQNDNSVNIDLLSKYGINTYEDMTTFINEFEMLQMTYEELIAEKEMLMKDYEILSTEKDELLKEIDSISNDKEELIGRYNSLCEEAEILRNHICPSFETGGTTTPIQPPVSANPIQSDPTPTDPISVDPEPTDPTPTDPTPVGPEPTDQVTIAPDSGEQQELESEDQQGDDAGSVEHSVEAAPVDDTEFDKQQEFNSSEMDIIDKFDDEDIDSIIKDDANYNGDEGSEEQSIETSSQVIRNMTITLSEYNKNINI